MNYRPVELDITKMKKFWEMNLYEDCRHSIRNSLLMFDHIIKKNRHTSSVEIVLVSIDLLLRY